MRKLFLVALLAAFTLGLVSCSSTSKSGTGCPSDPTRAYKRR